MGARVVVAYRTSGAVACYCTCATRIAQSKNVSRSLGPVLLVMMFG
jgi:hypothetical protein